MTAPFLLTLTQVLPWMYYRDEAARLTKANIQVASASERELARVRTAVLQVNSNQAFGICFLS